MISRKEFMKLPFGFLTSCFRTQHSTWVVGNSEWAQDDQVIIELSVNFIWYLPFESVSRPSLRSPRPLAISWLSSLGNLTHFHDPTNHFHMSGWISSLTFPISYCTTQREYPSSPSYSKLQSSFYFLSLSFFLFSPCYWDFIQPLELKSTCWLFYHTMSSTAVLLLLSYITIVY